jgi:hypothetical protein
VHGQLTPQVVAAELAVICTTLTKQLQFRVIQLQLVLEATAQHVTQLATPEVLLLLLQADHLLH